MNDEAKAIAYRVCSELMVSLGRELKREELVSVCSAAFLIAAESSAEARYRLEKYTVERAFAMVANGE